MLPTLVAEAAAAPEGFRWANLALLVVVALVAWPLYTRLRRSISQSRRERWAREERPWGYTEENDPDLRRDPADPPSR